MLVSAESAPATPPPSVLRRLREQTRVHHERIESLVPLLREDLTLEAYRAYLARLLGFYRPVERALLALAGWEETGIGRPREKAPLLWTDLRDLGAAPEDLAALPTCPSAATPRLSSLPRGMGCLYVLEGAALGGQILVRHVRRVLPLPPGRGAAFLHGYGDETARRWRRFGGALCAYVEGLPASRQERVQAQMIDAAAQTFLTLERWLS
jgi:heme oxygenase